MAKIVKAGVIGDPINHSLSPMIHRYWIKKYNIRGQYDAYHVLPKNLSEFVGFAVENLAGFNVTTPHKQAIIPYCDKISTVAAAVGAVNTIRIDNGTIFGDNTDVYGLRKGLSQNAVVSDKNSVCIIGAGGACRSAIQAVKQLGCTRILIANRTPDKAEKLAVEFNDTAIAITAIPLIDVEKYIPDVDILIHTSLAGMDGKNPLSLNLTVANPHMIVYDIVYKPLMTPLLVQAAALGLPTVTGIDMLLYQALLGFSYWFGTYPNIDDRLRNMAMETPTI